MRLVTRLEHSVRSRWRRRALKQSMKAAPPVLQCVPTVVQHQVLPDVDDEYRSALVEEAEAYLRHEWRFFGLKNEGEPVIDWRRDIKSGIIAPSCFSHDIDVSDTKVVGDIKVTWEKNRHHHLSVMAAAYALTQREEFAREIVAQIHNWIDDNPYLSGPNWLSSLGIGIRLISWVWCERLLRASPEYERGFGAGTRFWTSVGLQQRCIAMTPSNGASANNHLAGEMAGLFVAASAWPYFRKSHEWQSLAARVLQDQIDKQFYPSGINRELAFSYHTFVTEFYLLVLYEARHCGYSFSREFQDKVRRMVEAVPRLSDCGGNPPHYGDEDDGKVLQLDAACVPDSSWLYRVAADVIDARVSVGEERSVAAGLMNLQRTTSEISFRNDQSSSFRDAGLYTLVSRHGHSDEVFALVKAGPLGQMPDAAHGHADALSFTLSVGGTRIFVDPGTYSYHADPQWRNYFRSTAAHNTVEIDGKNQSVAERVFRWSHKANTRVLECTTSDYGGTVIAEHDGYCRLQNPVCHRREYQMRDKQITIMDSLSGDGEHRIQCGFHLDPHCSCKIDGFTATITCDTCRISVRLDSKLEWTAIRGGSDAGWYSPGFGRKVETTTILGAGLFHCPAQICTEIEIAIDSPLITKRR